MIPPTSLPTLAELGAAFDRAFTAKPRNLITEFMDNRAENSSLWTMLQVMDGLSASTNI
jgi:hypothetical protein